MTMLAPLARATLPALLLLSLAACERLAPGIPQETARPTEPGQEAAQPADPRAVSGAPREARPATTEAGAAASEPPGRQPLALASAPLPAAPPPPAVVETFAVASDLPASIVRALDGHAPTTIFLPGVCSNANAYLQSFPEAARAHGGIIAIDGDNPCPGARGFRTFSWDATKQHARIEAALRAAGVTSLPKEGITLIGYSQGATIAEQLAHRFPDRYARVMLIGAPSAPSVPALAEARAVVTSACSRDVTERMKTAARRLEAAGVPALYLQMPGCTHGNIAEGEQTFGAAFSFFAEKSRPPRPGAAEETLAP